jgi:hypothetical protein
MDNMPDCDELKIDFRELDSDLITQFIAKKLLFILNLKNRFNHKIFDNFPCSESDNI